ncbi:hypothetical protein [Sulfitobacter sp. R18_1]|uniref:hypothetical protein n=1 Tax=Sulfitobacter sp. R18_1 TaxID=2821104 RepID=UPI001AD9CEFF|nr:hypothetical protein [Sulfitobacter sp. R18_1]MBO9428700.1 hypothetical protein [Sulfitobacter sp. R18_1]
MTPNSIRLQVYTDMALKAKGSQEMSEVIQAAMTNGMEQGFAQKEREVEQAMRVLGLRDGAFSDGTEN